MPVGEAVPPQVPRPAKAAATWSASRGVGEADGRDQFRGERAMFPAEGAAGGNGVGPDNGIVVLDQGPQQVRFPVEQGHAPDPAQGIGHGLDNCEIGSIEEFAGTCESVGGPDFQESPSAAGIRPRKML